MSKTCFKCQTVKPLRDFYRHPAMRDGRLGKCKECAKRDVRHNRKKRLDYYRAYDMERFADPDRKKRVLESQRQMRHRWPEKYRARAILGKAVKRGLVRRPAKCQTCGKRGRIHGHHHDYTKPLDVQWLCVDCHWNHHRSLNV